MVTSTSLTYTIQSNIYVTKVTYTTSLTLTLQAQQFHCKCNHGQDKQIFERKIVDVFLPSSFNIYFGCSKEPSY